jgi:uridine kinase
MRIHITGASGSGTTTLGSALAQELNYRHLDSDSYYWLPTTPPFQSKRNATDRSALLQADLSSDSNVVLSGSIGSWGAELEDAFDLIVFLYLPVGLRLERLRRREIEKYGAVDPAFLQWASEYDTGPSEGRSLAKHNAWLAKRKCPVLRLEEDLTVAERVERVCSALSLGVHTP